jgi:hypothetical protein
VQVNDDMPAETRPAGRRIRALLAELVGGALVGLVLARAGGFAGAAIGRGNASEFGDLIGAVLGTFLGYIMGVAIGVAGAGRLVGQRGSFGLALLESIVGGVLIALLAEPLRLNQNSSLLSFAVFFASLALAVAGYNLRRR